MVAVEAGKVTVEMPAPRLQLVLSRVDFEVDRIENQTGRRPTEALVGEQDLAGHREVTSGDVHVRATPLVANGEIYLRVSA